MPSPRAIIRRQLKEITRVRLDRLMIGFAILMAVNCAVAVANAARSLPCEDALVVQSRISHGAGPFRRVIEVNRGSAAAPSRPGHAELQNKPSAAEVEGLKRAYDRSDHDPAALLSLIRALIESQRVPEAVNYGEGASKLKGWNPRLDLQLGLVFLRSHQCQAAQKSLRAAAKADPNLGDQVVRLSEAAFEDRKYDDALCLVTVALECRPASASLHSLAGACHYQVKDPTLAVNEVQQAVHLDPGNEDYRIQLAQIFIDYNTPGAAVLLLEPALSTFPESPRILYVLGVACLKSSQLRKADEYLRHSLRLEPRNPLTLRALAMLYEGEGKWAAVAELTDSMMQLPSQMYEGYYYRAEAQYNLSRNQLNLIPEIAGLLRKSVSLRPDFFPSHLLLGKILLAQGSYREAIGSLDRAVSLEPQSQPANYNLAMAYKKAGQSQKSSEAWKRFQVIVGQEKNKPPEKTLSYEVVTEQPTKR